MADYYWDMSDEGADSTGDGSSLSPWQRPPGHPDHNPGVTVDYAAGDTHYVKGSVTIYGTEGFEFNTAGVATEEAERITFSRWPGESQPWVINHLYQEASWLTNVWTSYASNVWVVNIPSFTAGRSIDRVLVEEVGKSLHGHGLKAADANSVDSTYRHFYDGTTKDFYLYSPIRPDLAFLDIAVVQNRTSQWCRVYDADFVTVEGCLLIGPYSNGFYGYIGTPGIVRQGLQMSHCGILFAGRSGYRLRSDDEDTSYWKDVDLFKCWYNRKIHSSERIVDGAGVEDLGDGFALEGGAENVTWRHCVSRDAGHTNFSMQGHHFPLDAGKPTYGVHNCVGSDLTAFGGEVNWGRACALAGFSYDHPTYGGIVVDSGYERIREVDCSVRSQIQGLRSIYKTVGVTNRKGSTIYVGSRTTGNGEIVSLASESDGNPEDVVIERVTGNSINDSGFRLLGNAGGVEPMGGVLFRNARLRNVGLVQTDATQMDSQDVVVDYQESNPSGFDGIEFDGIKVYNDTGNHKVRGYSGEGITDVTDPQPQFDKWDVEINLNKAAANEPLFYFEVLDQMALTPAAASGTGTALTATFDTTHILAPAATSSTGTATAPAVGQTNVLSPATASATATATNGVLLSEGTFVPVDASATATATAPALAQTHALATDSASNTGNATTVALTQSHVVSPSAATGTGIASSTTVEDLGPGAFTPDAATGTGTATAPALQQTHIALAASATATAAASNASLIGESLEDLARYPGVFDLSVAYSVLEVTRYSCWEINVYDVVLITE